MASFQNAIKISIGKKIREKDHELQSRNRKSRELAERMKPAASEAQQWCYRAKYNESVGNVLKAHSQEAMQGGGGQSIEGYGDSNTDDATSSIHPNNYLSSQSGREKSFSMGGNMICRTFKAR